MSDITKEINDVKAAVNRGELVQPDLETEEQKLTIDKLRYFLPKDSRTKITQETIKLLNDAIDESGCHRGLMEERLLSHMDLLGPGVGFKQLIKAIQFVTLSLTHGMTQSKAFMITFPDKADKLLARNADPSSHASQYASTKLPTKIMEAVNIGPSVTYAPLRHQIVDKWLQLMNGKAADGPASATVQLNATIALMEYIKVPEALQIQANHSMDDDSKAATQNLADEISRMATLMEQRHKGGASLGDVQRIGLVVEGEVIDES